jgi:hypothetical protein
MTETIRAASGATPPENLPGEHSWQGPLVREIPEEERDDRRCWVALRTGPSTTGEHCEGMAAYEVYGIPLCEVHGAESKAGALEELYFHASEDLIRPFNPHVALLPRCLWLRPFALPRPKHLRTLPARLLCVRIHQTAHTRRYEHPSPALLAPLDRLEAVCPDWRGSGFSKVRLARY